MDRLSGQDPPRLSRVVVAYDIGDDRRRARVADGLLDFVERVEYSVFDGWLTTDDASRAWGTIRPEVRQGDSAFVISLCRACWDAGGSIGRAGQPDPPGTSWVV